MEGIWDHEMHHELEPSIENIYFILLYHILMQAFLFLSIDLKLFDACSFVLLSVWMVGLSLPATL